MTIAMARDDLWRLTAVGGDADDDDDDDDDGAGWRR